MSPYGGSPEGREDTSRWIYKVNRKYITVKNINKNNLRHFSVKIPLQKLVVIVGPSGSGKSTLVHDVLYNNSLKNEWDIQNLSRKVEILEQKVIPPSNSIISLGEYNLNKLKNKLSAIKKGELLIVDEPCAGFCKKEREIILKLLKDKVKKGYSIIAVEHNKEIITIADYLIELGPGAGRYGGKLIFEGNLEAFKKSKTITAEHVFVASKTEKNNLLHSDKGKRVAISKISTSIFKNYTFSFPIKKIVCLTGCSGSGKSTLMHCLAGLDSVSSGQVFIGDTELTALGDRDLTRLRRDAVGFVFQAFNLVPTLTARENITLPLDIAGRKPDAEWLDTVIDTVGLRDQLTHKPSELSGGQQQRVACARALASRPLIVFADEPTGNLDSRSGAEVLSFLRRSVDDFGQTIVMVTHDPGAAAYSDRVVFLADGRVVDELRSPTSSSVLDRMKALEPAPRG